ncbi:MAG TPA: hypothetical protein VHU91_05930 [Mycobacteriales bacterium]|jgi:hypothetical protein|nr:hypothetical protein [Mycobacteriales bacterium]
MTSPLVSADFDVPAGLEHGRFRLRMLTVNDVVKDYDAVMSSVDHLQGVFGERSNWPSPDLTLEQDLIDLGWHQKEFQRRTAFAYTVMSLDETRCLGCVYFYPGAADAQVDAYTWVRAGEVETGLDAELFAAVRSWLDDSWPFDRVRFPGRLG